VLVVRKRIIGEFGDHLAIADLCWPGSLKQVADVVFLAFDGARSRRMGGFTNQLPVFEGEVASDDFCSSRGITCGFTQHERRRQCSLTRDGPFRQHGHHMVKPQSSPRRYGMALGKVVDIARQHPQPSEARMGLQVMLSGDRELRGWITFS